jgi:pyruvate/2-oxoacid:ferredoxin oxidoreductase alpha subunit
MFLRDLWQHKHNQSLAITQTSPPPAVRYAMLASRSIQEAHDMALISQAATLEARVPFLHFSTDSVLHTRFNKVEILNDEDLKAMIDDELVIAHRNRGLSPDRPSFVELRRIRMFISRDAKRSILSIPNVLNHSGSHG